MCWIPGGFNDPDFWGVRRDALVIQETEREREREREKERERERERQREKERER